jgi:hypothetical protein
VQLFVASRSTDKAFAAKLRVSLLMCAAGGFSNPTMRLSAFLTLCYDARIMFEIRLEPLKARLNELQTRCAAVTERLQEVPNRQELEALSAELRFIAEEAKRVASEHREIVHELRKSQ